MAKVLWHCNYLITLKVMLLDLLPSQHILREVIKAKGYNHFLF